MSRSNCVNPTFKNIGFNIGRLRKLLHKCYQSFRKNATTSEKYAEHDDSLVNKKLRFLFLTQGYRNIFQR